MIEIDTVRAVLFTCVEESCLRIRTYSRNTARSDGNINYSCADSNARIGTLFSIQKEYVFFSKSQHNLVLLFFYSS